MFGGCDPPFVNHFSCNHLLKGSMGSALMILFRRLNLNSLRSWLLCDHEIGVIAYKLSRFLSFFCCGAPQRQLSTAGAYLHRSQGRFHLTLPLVQSLG